MPNTQTFGLPYDYDSIMHYDSYAFSKNGKATMEPKQAGVKLIPQYYKTDAQIISPADLKALSSYYKCKI